MTISVINGLVLLFSVLAFCGAGFWAMYTMDD